MRATSSAVTAPVPIRKLATAAAIIGLRPGTRSLHVRGVSAASFGTTMVCACALRSSATVSSTSLSVSARSAREGMTRVASRRVSAGGGIALSAAVFPRSSECPITAPADVATALATAAPMIVPPTPSFEPTAAAIAAAHAPAAVFVMDRSSLCRVSGAVVPILSTRSASGRLMMSTRLVAGRLLSMRSVAGRLLSMRSVSRFSFVGVVIRSSVFQAAPRILESMRGYCDRIHVPRSICPPTPRQFSTE